MDEKPNSRNADGIFEPFSSSVVPWEHFEKGRFGLRYQHLSAFGGGTQISLALEILEPGKQANQAHYHLLEEEHLYLLEGELTVRIGEAHYRMHPGDYVCWPAGQKAAHALINESDQPCRYLVLGNPQAHDVAVFPDSERVQVRLMGEAYRSQPTLGYWEGIETGPLPDPHP